MENFAFNPFAISGIGLGVAFLIFGMARSSQAQTFAEVEKDCKKVDDAYQRFSTEAYSIFDQPSNGDMAQKIEVYLGMYNRVQTINEVSLKQAEQMLADFKKKYGQKGDNFSERFVEIRDADKSLDHSGSPQPVPSPPYDILKDAINTYREKTIQAGDDLALSASYTLDMIEYREDPQEVSNMIRDMVTALNLALKFDPNCARAKDLLAKAETIKKEKIKLIEESRKSARMPRAHPGFKGDGKAVVDKALEFINGKKTNAKYNYFAGTVGSPWFERVDMFGNTIDYTIQVNIAYQTQGEPANVVHVYKAVLYTCTKKPEASFCSSGVVLGWEFTMLKENMGK